MSLAVTAERLQAVVARLVVALGPEEVILFGSRARGTARPDSDADLFLILSPSTASSYRERSGEAWRAARGDLLQRGMETDVFPYTVPEIHERLARGDTVVRDALATGIVLHPAATPHSRYAGLAGEWSRVGAVEEWLQFAEDDIRTADTLVAAPSPVWRNVAYHAQQSAEKALKALVFHLGAEPHRTHDLTQLLLDIAEIDPVRGRHLLLAHQNAAADLATFAVTPRYPGSGAVTSEQAQAALASARAIMTSVRSTVQ